MNALSKILSAEYAADNIIVQMMTPGQVDTKFGQGVRTPAIVPADECVRYALKAVGTEQQTNGHPKVFCVVLYFFKSKLFIICNVCIAQIHSQCFNDCWWHHWRQIIYKVENEPCIGSQKTIG